MKSSKARAYLLPYPDPLGLKKSVWGSITDAGIGRPAAARSHRKTLIMLSATGTVDVSSGWGTHDARGTARFARVGGYPVNSPRRYGLAAKIGAQKWAYTGADVTAVQTGRLYLTCNDDAPSDNDGRFVVAVRIIRRR
jgi:hypothetical protein